MAYEKSKNEHYLRNREKYIAQAIAKRKRLREILTEAKAVPCMDCGVEYPYYVMDFDHRPGTVKIDNPGSMTNRGSERLLREEIAKCDIVCANCHRERTFLRGYSS